MAFFGVKNKLLREQHGQMARAKRHYLTGHVWHITHRCHKKEFLLREAQAAYNSNFAPENGVLSAKNTYFWSINS